jgi:glycosyltransferase involved in cell wall biosynthesis
MRILYISGDLGIEVSGRKGASTHIRETCRQLARRGHEVMLVTPCPGEVTDHGFHVTAVEPPRAKWMGIDLRYRLLDHRIGVAAARLLREFQPDVVYERYALYQRAGQRIAARAGLPHILEVNSVLAEEMRERLRLPAWAARSEARIWSSARVIICVSHKLEERIRAAVQARGVPCPEIEVSPVGVDPEQFRPDVEPVDWQQFGLGGKSIVGYAGTVTRWHGIGLLFAAAEIIRRRRQAVCFVVIGGETEKIAQLRRRAWELGVGDHLKFLGSFPHSEIPAMLTGMDACVIPDTQDWSSPTKYFEMAAAGRAVVAGRAPAIEEVVGGDGIGALLFERGNAADLVAKLDIVLSDRELAARLGRQARQRILERYTWDSNIARVLNLYARQGVTLSPADREFVNKWVGVR